MPRRGGKRRKTKTHVEPDPLSIEKVPQSFVFKRGRVGQTTNELVADLRRMMQPNTAQNLRERRQNSMKDYVNVAGPLGVSHFMVVTQTKVSTNLMISRLPRGPTLSFQVRGYSLMKHVKSSQRRPYETKAAYQTSPLVVLNNFTTDELNIKLQAATFQNMFPAIDVEKVKLGDCRRVVMFNYDKDTKYVEMRHYAITAKPLGISRSIKAVLSEKKKTLPNLSKLNDISDFVLGNEETGGYATSDSEVDDETSHVTLNSNDASNLKTGLQGQAKYAGRVQSQRSAIRLVELGPRLKLHLVKVQSDLFTGDTLYHSFLHKSKEEIAEIKKKKDAKTLLKKRRRDEQDANVERKRKEKEDKIEAKKQRGATGDAVVEDEDMDDASDVEDGSGLEGEDEDGRFDDDDDDAASSGEESGNE